MRKVLFHKLTMVSLILYLTVITACHSDARRGASYASAVELDGGCDPIAQRKAWVSKTQAFAKLSYDEKRQYVNRLEKVLKDSGQFETYESAYRYFTDMITESSSAPEPISLRSLERATVLELTNVPSPKPISLKPMVRPSWDGVPVSTKLKSKRVLVYRGDSRLRFNTADQSLTEKWSPFRIGLRELFSEGIDPYKKWNRLPKGADLTLHMITSGGSMFLSTSKQFEVARTFGKKAESEWSIIVEMVVDGYDLQKLETYFQGLDFINPNRTIAYISNESEISVSEPIQASSIRGVWLDSRNGTQIFIQNPNWNPSAAMLYSHAIMIDN